MVFFANSGTEAVEAALKLARAATGRPGLLHCERSYHGKSLGSLSVTGNAHLSASLRSAGARVSGDTIRRSRSSRTCLCTRGVSRPLSSSRSRAKGGMIVPPTGYLRAAQELCRAVGTLLIVDEVQTGLGRTGTLFAVEEEGVEPDVLTLAKSLGGGLVPLGTMLSRRDLWMKAYGSVQTFALHTSTFGGGSLACAAGLATLRVLREEDLFAKAQARGRQLSEGLNELSGRCGLVRGVRGRGLMLGVEFQPMPPTMVAHFKGMDPSGTTSYLMPNQEELIHSIPGMYAMQILLNAHAIYTQVTRSNPRVLRVQPPLTITQEQVGRFLTALESTCHELHFLNETVDTVIRKSIGNPFSRDPQGSAVTALPCGSRLNKLRSSIGGAGGKQIRTAGAYEGLQTRTQRLDVKVTRLQVTTNAQLELVGRLADVDDARSGATHNRGLHT